MHLRDIQLREASDSSHYWPDHKEGHDYLGVCLAGEVGEVCNNIKKLSRGTFDWDKTRSELMDELPDVLIYLVMLAEHFDIDLQGAYDHKKEYNEQRYGRAVTRHESTTASE